MLRRRLNSEYHAELTDLFGLTGFAVVVIIRRSASFFLPLVVKLSSSNKAGGRYVCV